MTLSSDSFPRLAEWRDRHGIRPGYILRSNEPKAPIVEQWHFPNGRVAYVFMYERDGIPTTWALAGEIAVRGQRDEWALPEQAPEDRALEALANWAGIE